MPTAPPPDQQAPDETATLAALTVILLSDQSTPEIEAHVVSLLTALGITAAAASAALALIHPHAPGPILGIAPQSASGHIARTETPRTAAYLLQAATRLAQGGDTTTERRYMVQHLQAQNARKGAAQRVDAAARMFGAELGWRAVLDLHTTPACRAAHGTNFHFATPPRIGYPGTPHGGSCRCIPGPPYDNARSVDEVTVGLTI